MANMGIDDTLGTDSSLVSLAVRVDLILRVFLAVKNSERRRGGSSLQGFVNGDELVASGSSRFKMPFLAVSTEAQGTILAKFGCLGLLADLADNIIRIHRFLLNGCSHHPSSEVIGGEILSPLQWNLEWTLTLWTLDFPAAARGCTTHPN